MNRYIILVIVEIIYINQAKILLKIIFRHWNYDKKINTSKLHSRMGGTISISVEEVFLRKHCTMVGNGLILYTLQIINQKKKKWNCFVDQVHRLLEVVQELNVVKLYGETKVWMLEKGIIAIYTKKLTKYKRWLPILVCPLTHTKIINIIIIPNHYVYWDIYWLPKLNINKLLLKWMLCDLVCYLD